MSDELELKQVDNGWLLISLRISESSKFVRVLEDLKRHLHVFTYDNTYKKYKVPIYEIPRIAECCERNNVALFAPEKIIRNFKRMEYKKKKSAEIKKSKKSYKKKEMKIAKWTEDPAIKLYDYQKLAVDLITFNRRYLLGDDMGVGKTPQAVAIILKSWDEYGFENAMIVTPNRLMSQWKHEIMKFSTLNHNVIEILGERKCYTREVPKFSTRTKHCKGCPFHEQCLSEYKDEKINKARFRTLQIRRAKILIAPYSSLDTHEKDYINRKFDVVIFDEASKIKNHSAKVTKSAKRIIHSLPSVNVVVPMSGTFIENKIAEAHSIIEMIRPNFLGTYDNFKGRYLYTDHFGNVTGIRNEVELKHKIEDICLRRTIDEVWKDRPEIMETYIECEMSDQQAKVYAEARNGALKQLKDLESQDKINQANIGALITYLLMTSCTVKSIDPETKIKHHSSKMDTLKEIITEEFPENAKMVIFSRFSNKVTPYLLKEMSTWGVGKILFAGPGDQTKQAEIIDNFKTKPEYRFLVCSDALAYGANFQIANYLVNFDLPWNPAVLDQRIRRVYRRGQHKSVTVINLIVPGTVEEDLIQVLNTKRETFAKFLKESVTGKGKTKRSSSSLSLAEMIKLI